MTDFGDVDEAAKELAAFEGAYEEAARALAAAHRRIRARHWPEEEEEVSLRAAPRFIAGRLKLEEAAEAVRTSEAALVAARAELRGAAVAAAERGVPKRKVAIHAGVSRVSLDDWLTPREE